MNCILYFLVWFTSLVNPKIKVDLIIYNAKIYTVDSVFSVQQAMVVDDGKIVTCGGNDVLQHYEADSVWNAKGKFIYPGFIDAHCHFSGYALSKSQLSLESYISVSQVLTALKSVEKKHPNGWVQARQWDETKVKDAAKLNRNMLDREFPDVPVIIMRIDGHSILCNTKALEMSDFKWSASSSDDIQNGWLRDNNMQYVLHRIPEVNESDAIQYLSDTEEEFLRNGVTSFVDCMVENSWIHDVMKAYEERKIRIHGNYVLTTSEKNLNEFLSGGKVIHPDYSICGFKVFADGTLGSKSAAMLRPYEHSEERGGLLVSRDSLTQLAHRLYSSHFQLMIHAIGDSSNRMVLQVLSEVLKKKNDRRWRVEHAQVVHPLDRHLFGEFSIIPSVQPTHALSDMRWLYERIGESRGRQAYAYQELLTQNGWLPLGTDFPVEPLNPLRTFCTAVFRKNEQNEPVNSFQMENAISREDALRGITIWAARSVFEEKKRGSLEPGKVADFVVLPIDLMQAEMEMIYQTKVLKTYMNGIEY